MSSVLSNPVTDTCLLITNKYLQDNRKIRQDNQITQIKALYMNVWWYIIHSLEDAVNMTMKERIGARDVEVSVIFYNYNRILHSVMLYVDQTSGLVPCLYKGKLCILRWRTPEYTP